MAARQHFEPIEPTARIFLEKFLCCINFNMTALTTSLFISLSTFISTIFNSASKATLIITPISCTEKFVKDIYAPVELYRIVFSLKKLLSRMHHVFVSGYMMSVKIKTIILTLNHGYLSCCAHLFCFTKHSNVYDYSCLKNSDNTARFYVTGLLV